MHYFPSCSEQQRAIYVEVVLLSRAQSARCGLPYLSFRQYGKFISASIDWPHISAYHVAPVQDADGSRLHEKVKHHGKD